MSVCNVCPTEERYSLVTWHENVTLLSEGVTIIDILLTVMFCRGYEIDELSIRSNCLLFPRSNLYHDNLPKGYPPYDEHESVKYEALISKCGDV